MTISNSIAVNVNMNEWSIWWSVRWHMTQSNYSTFIPCTYEQKRTFLPLTALVDIPYSKKRPNYENFLLNILHSTKWTYDIHIVYDINSNMTSIRFTSWAFVTNWNNTILPEYMNKARIQLTACIILFAN
jgi:hypothetical protein